MKMNSGNSTSHVHNDHEDFKLWLKLVNSFHPLVMLS